MEPWRLLLPRISSPPPQELDDLLYEAMLALESQRKNQPFKWGEESQWSADQKSGRFTLEFADGMVSGQMQVIGSFDGETFMWAWNNRSVQQALRQDVQKVRTFGEQRGWSLFSQPKFPAISRDGYAIAALAAQLTDSQGAYAGNSDGTMVYMTLHNLRRSDGQKVKKLHHEASSPFQQIFSMIAAQSSSNDLAIADLREVEMMGRRGCDETNRGDYAAAARIFDEAWQRMGGQYAWGQEPSGWVQLAKGNALVLAGRYEQAMEALTLADKIRTEFDRAFLYRRMGQCQLALGNRDRAIDFFARSYVAAGPQSFAELPQSDGELFWPALAERKRIALDRVSRTSVDIPNDSFLQRAADLARQITERRIPATKATKSKEESLRSRAARIVTCLIADLHAFEVEANELSHLDEIERRNPHRTGAVEQQNRETIDVRWAWILATWFTPVRSPNCGGSGWPPQHDPAKERVARVWRPDDGLIAVETVGERLSSEERWRYEFTEFGDELLVTQVFSIFSDGEECLLI